MVVFFFWGSFLVVFLEVPELIVVEVVVFVTTFFGSFVDGFLVVVVFAGGRHTVEPLAEEPLPEELPAGELRDEEDLDEEPLQFEEVSLDPERLASFLRRAENRKIQ